MAKVTGPPNDKTRVERTRKAEKCQWCGTKVSLKDQYTVVNDLDENKVVKRKNAARKGAEGMSHWCGDCAEKRVKMSQRWLDRRAGKPAAKKAPAKKAAATTASTKPKRKTKTEAKPARPKRTTRRKRGEKKSPASTAKASGKTADPF